MELWSRILEVIISPPGIIVVLLFFTYLAYLRSNWLGTAMLALSTSLLVAVSLPLTALQLMNGLQNFAKPPELVAMAEKGPQSQLFVPLDSRNDPPDAIVVLGSGRYTEAPEYQLADTVNAQGLERLRYAAQLQRKTGLPILVSGGAPGGEDTREADHMQSVLVEDFRASVKWVERDSRTTLENARYSKALLGPAKVKQIYLVTHAWHMRRATSAFESEGIKVVPAPTGYYTLSRLSRTFSAYLPSARAMYYSSLALHEYLGLLSEEAKENEKDIGRQRTTDSPAPESAPAKPGKKK